MPDRKEYRYREGCHGEHCVDYGEYIFDRKHTVGRAATKQDALRIVEELNAQLPEPSSL